MINYSIIIPHKNTPELLRKCLDSIPRRDDIQIIVVDDNSDADKVDFEHFPGLGEPHTEVYFTKEGRGAGYARNVGLEHAIGKWIVFSDADDYFLPEFANAMDSFLDSDYDLVYFKMDVLKFDNTIKDASINEYVDLALCFGDFYKIKFWMTIPVAKFVKRLLINTYDINFEEIRWSNDVLFATKIGLYAKKVGVGNQVIYRNVVRKESLRQKNTLESNIVRLKADCRSFDLLKKNNMYDGMKEVVGCTMGYWIQIFYESKIDAIKLIPVVVKTMGLKCWLNAMNRNKKRMLKSFVKKI